MAFLKQCIGSNIPPKSFNSLDNIALPSFIRSSRRLADQHGKIIQRTKTDLFAVFIQGAESTMRQYQQQFDHEIAQLWQNYRHSSHDQRISKAMVDLIDTRLSNVTARFQHIRQFQTNSFFCQAPTM